MSAVVQPLLNILQFLPLRGHKGTSVNLIHFLTAYTLQPHLASGQPVTLKKKKNEATGYVQIKVAAPTIESFQWLRMQIEPLASHSKDGQFAN